MGNQSSGTRNDIIPNDLSPLHFHTTCGGNIRLPQDRQVAKRTDSFCKGIAFSQRSVAVGEKVYLKFAEVSTNWSGVLRFGFTSRDPSSLPASSLPRYACPDLTNKQGFWAKALGERHAQLNDILCFYVTRNGEVHYSINGDSKGVFFSGVNTSNPLWVILDIYGNTIAVEFLEPEDAHGLIAANRAPSAGQLVAPMSSLHLSQEELDTPLQHFRDSLNPSGAISPLGRHVLLKQCGDDRPIAVRQPEHVSCNAYVFLGQPMRPGNFLVVKVVGTTQVNQLSGLTFGLTSCDPSLLSKGALPDDSDLLLDRPEYWIVNKDVHHMYSVGDEFCFSVEASGEVRMARNAQPASTLLWVDATQPLWPFIDLLGETCKLKFMGVGVSPDVDDNAVNAATAPVLLSSPVDVSTAPSNPASAPPADECIICYERPAECVLYVCGHLCLCDECANNVRGERGALCPICRKPISDIIKVYRP